MAALEGMYQSDDWQQLLTLLDQEKNGDTAKALATLFERLNDSYQLCAQTKSTWRNSCPHDKRAPTQRALLRLAEEIAEIYDTHSVIALQCAAHAVLPLQGAALRLCAQRLAQYPTIANIQWIDILVHAIQHEPVGDSTVVGGLLEAARIMLSHHYPDPRDQLLVTWARQQITRAGYRS